MHGSRTRPITTAVASVGLFAAGYLTHLIIERQRPVARTCFIGDLRLPDGSTQGEDVPSRYCLSFGPVVRFRGIWSFGLEQSSFAPLLRTPEAGSGDLWLEMEKEHASQVLEDLGTR